MGHFPFAPLSPSLLLSLLLFPTELPAHTPNGETLFIAGAIARVEKLKQVFKLSECDSEGGEGDVIFLGATKQHDLGVRNFFYALAWLLLQKLEILSGLRPDLNNSAWLVCLSVVSLCCCFAAIIPSSLTNHIKSGLEEHPLQLQSLLTGALGVGDTGSVLDTGDKTIGRAD